MVYVLFKSGELVNKAINVKSTRRTDPVGHVQWVLKNEIRAEFATVAWCNFYECLKQYPLVKGPKLNSLHLCEAPGAFIAALNHFLYSSYNPDEVQRNWLSTTMNPYYEGKGFFMRTSLVTLSVAQILTQLSS